MNAEDKSIHHFGLRLLANIFRLCSGKNTAEDLSQPLVFQT
jgi:hypothetical protein